MAQRICRAEEVERDPISKKVLLVRIQYFKDGELLHDVQFFPALKDGQPWVRIPESGRIVGGYIPWNRYLKMRNMALAIVTGKKKKPPQQLESPFP